uniref:rRNA adenine N(6)-methyltransferase n=1 Tax=Sphenodon punctatus TaxID=8508 RepID=A0A8D0H0Q6_SPHPU
MWGAALFRPRLARRRALLAVLRVAAGDYELRPIRLLRGLGARCLTGQGTLPLLEAAEAARLVQATARPSRQLRRFISSPEVASVVSRSLQCGPGGGREPVVLECGPGPGVLTRTLLNAGCRVVALESDKAFLPGLESLENKLQGQLKVVHCDFFRLDPLSPGLLEPPAMHSERLFEKLGISTVPWTADVAVRVVGFFPQKKESNMLWRHLYSIYERASIYTYGRIELNMFISEKEYMKLVAKPGESKCYQACSVIWQTACEIQLLHMEPWSSFLTNSKTGGLSIPKSWLLPNDHLCLVRLTPRRNLFTRTLTAENSIIFIQFVKQCLVKRKSKLIDKLNLFNPDRGKELLRQLEIPETITTGNLFPEEYRCLFEAIEDSNELGQNWLYGEALEDYQMFNF